jgi:hypothetical protein
MKQVTLTRFATRDSGTYGKLRCEDFVCFTAELPWRMNLKGISCIPAGKYQVRVIQSPKFGKVYNVQAVPNRSHILIHSGNFSGDTSKGFVSHVEGCILLGKRVGRLQNKYGKLQTAVMISKPTVTAFMEFMQNQEFTLTVTEDY